MGNYNQPAISNDTRERLLKIKLEIETKAKIEYDKRFLEETGLKVNDIVLCSFHISHGTNKQSYSSLTIKEGVIKEDSNGILYVESCEVLQESFHKSNGRSGSSYKGWWEYRMVKMKEDISAIK